MSKPTGSPHVGNLFGAIRPASRLADEGLEAMYFIADYHALTTVRDSKVLTRLTYEVAATWPRGSIRRGSCTRAPGRGMPALGPKLP